MKKVFISLSLVLTFSNAMAKGRVHGIDSGDRSNIEFHGGYESGDGKLHAGGGFSGGRS